MRGKRGALLYKGNAAIDRAKAIWSCFAVVAATAVFVIVVFVVAGLRAWRLAGGVLAAQVAGAG